MTQEFVCLNGEYVASADAAIQVADRLVRLGDGVFETIALADGVPYQWELHLARMEAGLSALRIPVPQADWGHAARQLLHKNHARDGFLRISVSRGVGSEGYLPTGKHPHWHMETVPARPVPHAPCRLWESKYTRPDSSMLPVQYKLTHGIHSTLALLEAQDHDCDEALLCNKDGVIACAAAANIFWIKGRTLFTPSPETGCLLGTTRDAVLRLSPYPVHPCAAEVDTLEDADVVFLTNIRAGIRLVARLEPRDITYTNTHPMLETLQQLLTEDKENYVKNNHLKWKHKK